MGLLHHIPKFHGLSMEDPNKHLKEFEVVCSSMTPMNVDGSILKMKAFPFSLLEKAKDWLYELAPGTVTSWETLVDKTPMTTKTLIANRALNAQQYEGVGQIDNPRQQQVNDVVEKPKEQSVAACGVCSMNGHLTNKCPQLIENGGQQPPGFYQRPYAPAQPQTQPAQNKLCSSFDSAQVIQLLTTLAKAQENQAKDMHNYAKEMQNQAREVTELKRQMGQMAEFMGQFSREPGKLPSSTDVNLKGGLICQSHHLAKWKRSWI
ncbi:hypothetical protein ACFX2J_018851 [Malus domestica]